MKRPTSHTVDTDQGAITYYLEIKKVKNINLRIKEDASVWVSAPANVPIRYIDSFIVRKREFIFSAVERIKQVDRISQSYNNGDTVYINGEPYTVNILQGKGENAYLEGDKLVLTLKDINDAVRIKACADKYLNALFSHVISGVADEICPLFEPFGVSHPQFRTRKMKSCWGTCHMKKKVVTLNKSLCRYPRECVEYVMMHEMCHFLHPDHSPEFKESLSRFMPDWKERKKLLNSLKRKYGIS